eukprot:3307647-Rhodomonas_salina.2
MSSLTRMSRRVQGTREYGVRKSALADTARGGRDGCEDRVNGARNGGRRGEWGAGSRSKRGGTRSSKRAHERTNLYPEPELFTTPP